MLGTLEPSKKTDWKAAVAPLVHAHNCTRHDSTSISPYELMLGRKPRLAIATLGLVGTDPQESNFSDFMEKLRERVDKAYQIANEAAKSSQVKQKLYYDKK